MMRGERRNRERELGDLLQRVVNRVSHRPQGESLAIMNEAGITLPQVLMLNRLLHQEASTASSLAESLNMSLPAVSQMLDRLVQLGLVERDENPEDRRQRKLKLTGKAISLARRIGEARSAEYNDGVSGLSPKLRQELVELLRRVLGELENLPNSLPDRK